MKKFLAIALAALMLFSLAACGGNTDETTEVVKIIDINLQKKNTLSVLTKISLSFSTM